MKIRTDFVSNSSSSSFVVWGYNIENNKDEMVAYLAEQTGDEKEKIKEDFYNYLDKVLTDTGIEFIWDDYDYRHWAGISPTKMGGDETKNQFLARVQETMKKVFPDIDWGEPYWIEEGWYDG